MSFTRSFDLIDPRQQSIGAELNFHKKMGASYEEWNWDKIEDFYCSFCTYIHDLSAKKGDLIILMPTSALPEWVLVDLALQNMGMTVVMAHATLSSEQLKLIIDETEAKHFFYVDPISEEKYREVLKSLNCHQIESLSLKEKMSWEEIDKLGETVKEDDVSTIIYTSGTTGIPKGVMLTHKNIMSNVQSITLLLPIGSKHRVLSFLPYSHVFERTAVYCQLALRSRMYFIGSPQNLAESLPIIKPHFFTAVPRLLEKMHSQVVEEFSKRKWLSKKVLHWASRVSLQYKPHRGFNPIKWMQIMLIRHVMLRGFRNRLGGNIEAIMVGAAHLREEISKAFFAAGITVREGYGMTETSPVISFNRFEPGLNRMSTVGLLLPNVQLEIRDQNENQEGEIFVKGPNVMKGYYKKPEATASVLDAEGWLATGDVGKMEAGKFLKITDRKKDIFKTSTGKYIAPMELEQIFAKEDLFETIMIIGFQKPFVTALILPNFFVLERWAKENNIHWTSPQYMVLNIKVKEYFDKQIELVNDKLPNYKKVRNFHLMHEPWTIEDGQLSNTLKPIRKKIISDFEREIGEMYE